MKKGFTLIELMGVIAIITIIGSVATVTVNNNIYKSRMNLCKAQENTIIEAAKMYLVDNPNKNINNSRIKVVSELQDQGYLDEELVNPINKEKYNNSTYVLVENEDGTGWSYSLKYVGEDATTCGYEKGTEIVKVKDLTVTLNPTTYVYDGTEKTPTVKVYDTKKNKYLKQNTEYKVTYKDNINVGTATAIITGIVEEYIGESNEKFTITPLNTAKTGTCNTLVYNGKSQTLINNGEHVTYVNNTRTADGTQKVTIKSKDNYAFSDGTKEKTLNCIIAKAAPIPTDSLCASKTYNGSYQQLTNLVETEEYILSNYSQLNAGTYTITANLKNGYRWSDNTADTKTFNCTMKELTKPTCSLTLNGTIGSNSWYTSNVTVVMTIDGLATSKGLATSTNSTNNLTTVTHTSDTASVTYYGYVANAVGSNSCSITFKRDATQPTCAVGTYKKNSNGYFNTKVTDWQNVNLKVKGVCSDNTSGCQGNQDNLTNTPIKTAEYKNNTNTSVSPGTVCDNAGLCKTCGKSAVKIDKTKPTCSVSISSKKCGQVSAGKYWYKTASVSFSDDGGSKVASKTSTWKAWYDSNCNYKSSPRTGTLNNTKFYCGNYNRKVTIYGSVKDNAGNEGSCDKTFYTNYPGSC